LSVEGVPNPVMIDPREPHLALKPHDAPRDGRRAWRGARAF
jgi:hypothetical protein